MNNNLLKQNEKILLTEQQLTRSLLERDPLWHVQLTIIAAICLQISLPDKYSAGPRYLLPFLEVILLIVLSATLRNLFIFKHILRRINAISIVIIIGLGNVYALQHVSHELLTGGKINNGHALILSAINIYLTNVIVFALLYWIIDGGGPAHRHPEGQRNRDFLFTQMTANDFVAKDWVPGFVDYLALAGYTATAFSPTDTMPLTRRAKMLLLFQSLVSLVIIGLVAARAVNILS